MTTIPKRYLFFCALYFCLTATMLFGQMPPENKGVLSFSVKVAEENSPLYSSPDEENSYMTGRVKAGEILEVCFRTDDGWCAVRPPEGSFSWINADYVLRGGSGTGTVICSDSSKEVPVRVGAASILNSSDVQVGLENGRQVQILGEQTLTGNKTWLKISPPRGEFRWIRLSALEQDEFLSQIPRRLTRYEELLAENTPSAMPESNLQINPETFSRLDEEKIDPNAPRRDDISDPIRKVSFDNTFNKELALLYRDLFAAIGSSESEEAFEYLSRRGSALESIASDENQRAEAQKLNAQILIQRRVRSTKGAENQTAGFPIPAEARSVYQFPAQEPSNSSEQVLFAVPQSRSGSSQPHIPLPASKTPSEKASNRIRFAFAPRDERISQSAPSEKKGLFSAKPSAIVPPANYTYPAPAQLKISSPSGSGSNPIPPEYPIPSATQPSPQNQADPSKVFIAHDQPSQEIRQVSALFVRPDISGATVSDAVTQDMVSSQSFPIPQSVSRPLPTNSSHDITGVLGYLPNSTDGAPSYALISKIGNRNSILCYVVPQQGKSLDPYVGKKIAVNGSRGWFKKGEENRKMIVAESIRIY